MSPTHPTDKDISAETLSQLMDGEWQDLDRSQCVEGICAERTLRATWARWHLARDALKGESMAADLSLCDRIRLAIDDEPAHSNVVGIGGTGGIAPTMPARHVAPAVAEDDRVDQPLRRAPASRGRQAAMGFGLAASAALVTVVGLSMWQNDATPTVVAGVQSVVGETGTAAPVVATGRLPAVDLVGNAGSFWVSGSDGNQTRSAAEDRLNQFLTQHLESAPSASREGLLPYSRLVGYDQDAAAVGQR